MNPLRIAAWAAQLVCDLFAPVQPERVLVGQHAQKLWPDGEQPLIDIDDDPFVSDSYLRYHDAVTAHLDLRERQESAPVEPMPGWFRGGFDEDASAPSGSATATRVDPSAEGPAAGRAHTLAAGHPNVTAALLIAAAIGLREYADSDVCETPTYWRNIADQLDPK